MSWFDQEIPLEFWKWAECPYLHQYHPQGNVSIGSLVRSRSPRSPCAPHLVPSPPARLPRCNDLWPSYCPLHFDLSKIKNTFRFKFVKSWNINSPYQLTYNSFEIGSENDDIHQDKMSIVDDFLCYRPTKVGLILKNVPRFERKICMTMVAWKYYRASLREKEMNFKGREWRKEKT